MKAEHLIFLAAAGLGIYFMSRPSETYLNGQNENTAPPELIQSLAVAVRRQNPEIYPIDTIFANVSKDGMVTARMLFMNLRGYFGIQYDIVAQASKGGLQIVSLTEQVQPEFEGPFQPFRSDIYAKFANVRQAVLATIHGSYK